MRIAVGADLSKGSWVGVRLEDGRFQEGGRFPTLKALDAALGPGAGCMAIDIPLSYPDPGTKGRPCEREGRRRLGLRRSSMFDTYPEAVLAAPTFAAANALALATVGCGLTQQSYRLGPAIREAIAFAVGDPRVVETHPELMFLRQGTPFASKKTWSGLRQRLAFLEALGLNLPTLWPAFDGAAHDDVLDAAAAAWVADAHLRGEARRVPADPAAFPIWC